VPAAVQECLSHIIAALDRHPSEVDIQTKGLVLLGVLIQVRKGGAESVLGAAVSSSKLVCSVQSTMQQPVLQHFGFAGWRHSGGPGTE
jgi:hypothetical protein